MTDIALPPRRRPFFEITGFKFRLWPIVLAAVLMQAVLVPAREAARWVFKHNPDIFHGQAWAFVGLAMLFQALVGLAGIWAMRRLLPAADTHLRWPPGKSCVGLAVMIGLAMGLIMLVADYWPQLLSHTAPEAGYATDPRGAAGWIGVMALTGFDEEPVFRGLLVGMLTVLVPGRVRLGAFEIPMGGVIMALLFGAAHYQTFFVEPLHLAVAQQLYAFVWGVTYVWLMERSKSLLAPIVAHGLGDAVEVAAVIGLMVAWG
jgi:membrane protease YdiL (CAAX protease family)